MKHIWVVLGLVLCLGMLESCDWFGPDPQKQKEARAGLDQMVANLPHLAELTVVKAVYLDSFRDDLPGGPFYLAGGYFVIGTQLSVSEALDRYMQQLELSSWVPRGDQYETSRVLYHGSNEIAVMDSGPPGPELETAVDYVQVRSMYRTLIFLRLTYGLQSR